MTWKKILLEGDTIPASDVAAGEFPDSGYTFAGAVGVDTINEKTADEGVTVDSVNLKDRTVAADAIIVNPPATPNAAETGGVRLPNDVGIVARNAANTADVELIKLNADDEIEFGAPLAREGAADGLATLDSAGKLASAQLPAWVDWTPTVTQGAATPTCTVRFARYYLIGKMAHVRVQLTVAAAGAAGAAIRISSAPAAITPKWDGSAGSPVVGAGYCSHAGNEYDGTVRIYGNNEFGISINGAGWVGNNPNFALANNDALMIAADYEVV